MSIQNDVTAVRERLLACGYQPVAVRTFGKAPVDLGWQKTTGLPPYDKDLANTGVLCGEARGVDLDIDDPEAATQVAAMIEAHFGPAPTRVRSNSPRRLLVFRCAGPPRPKRVIKLAVGEIELLGLGQQFVGFGRHPTGVPYEWRGASLDEVPLEDLPAISEEQEAALEAALVARWPLSNGAREAASSRPNGASEARRPLGDEAADAEDALRHLPNDYDAHDDWLRIGMSAFVAGVPLAAFDEWSRQHKSYDPERTASAWRSFERNGVRDVTAATLFGFVRERRPAWKKPSERTENAGEAPPDGDDWENEETEPPKPPEPFPLTVRTARPPETIPPRRWLYGTAYMRTVVAALVGPGAAGKSILAIVEALSLATGRKLLNDAPVQRCRVLYWNLEDSDEEIERRIAAVAQHFGIRPDEYAGWLFWASGHDMPLKLARADKAAGFRIDTASLARLEATVRKHAIDVITLDPVVSAHSVPENDTGAIDALVKALAGLAARTLSAILLAHHVRKGPPGASYEISADDARGAVAFVNACRIVRLIQKMTADDARTLNVDEAKRWRFFRLVDGKPNNAPPAEASQWLELRSVSLGNGDETNPDGDAVGIPTPWDPPGLFDRAPGNIADLVVAKAKGAQYRADPRARRWFGTAIGPLTGHDITTPTGRTAVSRTIRVWIENGALIEVTRSDEQRRPRAFIGVPGVDDPEE